MPLYAFSCINGHSRDFFFHNPDARALGLVTCECGETMTNRLSVGRGLTFFEEGRGRWIYNMGHDPVYITSHEQHKAEMKKRKLEWTPPSRGNPGCWS